jgi:prolyl-tRNA editing enzyme YbaK/EbsC (Cys-tRNA(Pro) deacylase)
VFASRPNHVSLPHLDRLASVHLEAPDHFLQALQRRNVEHRAHEPVRHARHLASIWAAALSEAGRATLFYADGRPVLALVPADRKVSAPTFKVVLGVSDLRVLRGDRGVGRLGWRHMPGEPGALPAVPGMFGAICYVDRRVFESERLIVSLGGGRSVALSPQAYVEVTAAILESFTGTTRLLPEGGMVNEVVPPS